jgi:hypothetical protein
MAGTLNNLLAGVPRIYVAPVDEALPELNDLTPPNVTVTTPGGNWSPQGYTMEDYSFVYAPTITERRVNEHAGRVGHDLITEDVRLAFMLAENDLNGWANAISAATVATVAAANGQTGQTTLGVGDGPLRRVSLLLIGQAPGTTAGSRAIHLYRCLPTNEVTVTFSRGHRGQPVEFQLEVDPDKDAGERLYKVYDITAPATS